MAFGDERKPLQRKTPLARGGSPRQGGALRRVPPGRTPSERLPPLPVRSASVRRARPAPVSAELALYVLERAEYRCDRCGVSIVGREFSRQHRRARGAGGRRDGYLNTAENLIILCGSATTPDSCHDLVEHQERAEAYRLGFAIRGEAQDPAAVPIFRHLREWQQPTADGWLPAEPIEGVAA